MDDRLKYAAVTGKVIATLRAAKLLNQQALATLAGLSQSSLSRFENGQSLPDAYELRALARAFGQKPNQLVEKIEEAFERSHDAAKKSGFPQAEVAAGVFVVN